jgi:ABC-type nickel/cobalt efflux system permease component RcnA
MRRMLVLLVVAAAALPAPAASAHPLGNFTVNRLDVVTVARDHVGVRWVLDQAEIPTFRERGLSPAAVLARKEADALRGLRLRVDDRPAALRLTGPGRIAFPAGQGGLRTTRVELALRADVRGARAVDLRDDGERGRLGWRAIVVTPGSGTAVRADVPAQDVTRGLRAYPRDLLGDPADIRAARLSVAPGHGTVTAPRARGAGLQTTSERSGDAGFAGLFADAAAGRGALLLLLLAAAGWGAVHALSPGHGKTMVAAYLVGTRGTARQAVALGATVTVSHTIGVFALGAVALGLSQWVLPETLYPWLTLISGLMILAVGAAVLNGRVRAWRGAAGNDHHHHDDGHGHGHDHGHGHGHAAPRHLTGRSLVALGASAGIIPCPSALVVLLAAVAQHEIALGLLLIVALSLGLASTLTGVGLLVERASRLLERAAGARRAAVVLPAVSALVIVGAGLLLTVQAAGRVVL